MCTSLLVFLAADLLPVRGFPQAEAICRGDRDLVMEGGDSRAETDEPGGKTLWLCGGWPCIAGGQSAYPAAIGAGSIAGTIVATRRTDCGANGAPNRLI
jgi:hypothetical protein